MTKPVILICGSDAIKGQGGHQTLVRATARAARKAGFDPRVFCAAPKSAIVHTDFGVIHYVASPYRTVRNTTAVWHTRFISAGVIRFLKDQPGPHLIHAFGLWGRVAVDVSQKLERAGRPATAIISVYETIDHETSAAVRALAAGNGWRKRLRSYRRFIWNRLVVRRSERYAFTRARLLMMNYESVRRLVRASYGDGPELRIMPYSSETAFLDPGGPRMKSPAAPEPIGALQNQDAPLIVSASRHSFLKGVHVLIHALALLNDSGVRFRACLVGGWHLIDDHRRLSERLGLEGVVAITGFVPSAFDYIRQADIFVLPSLEEGSGSISLIEALQARVAVVASNIDGIPEDVIDQQSALLVEPGNVRELSGAIGRLIADAGLRDRLADSAAKRFAEKFSAAAFTKALAELYAELGLTPEGLTPEGFTPE